MTASRGCARGGAVRIFQVVSQARSRGVSGFLLALLAIAFWLPTAPALAAAYQYDANGRLQSVTNSSGDTAHYVYDSRGNLIRIERTASTQLAITAFAPNNGVPGTQVAISGTQFGATTSANAVAFNGTAAAVLSATSTQLLVQVPQNATTGPISVAVGGGAVTSAESFTVTQVGQPPTITGLTPLVAIYGSLVTISGQHLAPEQGQTTVWINGTDLVPITASDQQLAIVIPSALASGQVTVCTPFGCATSANYLSISSFEVEPGEIASQYPPLPINGAATDIALPAPNDYAALLFQGNEGDSITLWLSWLSGVDAPINYTVVSPTGALVATGGFYSNSPVAALPSLPATGTYLVLLSTQADSAQLSLSVTRDLTVAQNADGTSVNYATGAPGQAVSITFSGTAGDNLGLGITGLAVGSSSVSWADVALYGPDGTQLTSFYCESGSSCISNVHSLPASGTYRLHVVPQGAATMSFTATLSKAVSAALPSDGTPISTASTAPAQVIALSFSGQAGQSLTAALGNLVVNPATGSVTVNVYKPSGTILVKQACWPGDTGCVVNLPALPETGTYILEVLPGNYGTISFTGTLSQNLTGALALDGSSNSFNTAIAGQAVLLSFSGTAGQDVGVVNVQSLAFNTSVYSAATIYVYKPDGTLLASPYLSPSTLSCSSGSSCNFNLGYLPTTGTYRVQIVPNGAVTMSFTTLAGQDITGSLPSSGTSVGYSTSAPGQGVSFGFTGTTAENLGVVQIQGLTGPVYVNVYSPDGTLLLRQYCAGTTTCGISLGFLPQNGNYKLEVIPTGASSTVSFSVNVLSNVTGTLVTDGTANNYATTVAGQSVALNFSANAGDNLGTLTLSALALQPNGSVILSVYAPNGTQIVSQYCFAAPCSVDLSYLPYTGNYQLQIAPSGGSTAAFTIAVAPVAIWTLPSNGTASQITTTANQTAYLRFSGVAGQSLNVVINGLTLTPVEAFSGYAYVYILQPGIQQPGFQYCYVSSTTACTFQINKLPATGTYQVDLSPGVSDGVMSFSAAVVPDVTGTLATNGTATSVATTVGGQAAALTFTGTAGQTLGLGIVGSTSAFSGSITIVQPDGSTLNLNDASCYGSCSISLGTLSQTGAYLVVIAPATTTTMNAMVSLAPPVPPGSIALNGAAVNLTVNPTGPGALSFYATEGQRVAITLSGSTFPGIYPVSLLDPDGATVTSVDGYGATSVFIGPENLAQAGIYQVVVGGSGSSGSVSIQVVTVPEDVLGTITLDGPAVTMSIGFPGQGADLTFSGTAGQTIYVEVPGDTFSSPSGGYSLSILSPDHSSLESGTSGMIGSIFGPYTLPLSGTYTIAVNPQGGTGSATIQLVSEVSNTSGSTTIDGATATMIAVPGTAGATLTFSGSAGQRIGLYIGGAVVNGGVNLLNPDGSTGFSTSTNPYATFLPYTLPQTGIYTLALQATYGVASMSLQVVSVPTDTTKSINENGASVTGQTTAYFQGADFTFQGSTGQTITLALSAVNFSGSIYASYGYYFLSIVNPDGSVLLSQGIGAGAASYGPITLTQSGTHTVIIMPILATGSFTAALTATDPVVTGTLSSSGTTSSYTTAAPGEDAVLTFAGSAGQETSVEMSGLQFLSGTAPYVLIYVIGPDGNVIAQGSCHVSDGECTLPIKQLPASGNYTVKIVPNGSATMTFSAALVAMVSVTAPTDGSAVAVSTSVSGQGVAATFSGTAGQRYALAIGGLTLTPTSITSMGIVVNQSNGSQLLNQGCYGGCEFDLGALPATGTYTVWITPGGAATSHFNLAITPDQSAALASDGSSTSVATSAIGQIVDLSFTGTAGQSPRLGIGNLSLSPSSVQGLTMTIYKPDGSTISPNSNVCYVSSNGCSVPLGSLPASGSYRVHLVPSGPATASFSAAVTLDQSSTITADGTSTSYSTSQVGQGVDLSFSGTAGQTLGFAASSYVPHPSNTNFYVRIYKPDGTSLLYQSFQSSNQGGTAFLGVLPMSGIYTIQVFPEGGSTISFTATLSPVVAVTLAPDGTQTSVATTSIGQIAELGVAANAGQSLNLSLSALTSGVGAATIQIFDPYGVQVVNSWCSASWGSCTASVSGLLSTGTYEAVVIPQIPKTMSFNVGITVQ
jgi:YD repeat-containing protein